jgi:hypothetical protein
MTKVLLTFFVSIILLGFMISQIASVSFEEKIRIYSIFADVESIEDDTEEDALCFNDSLHPSLCPVDETISCGPIEGIKEFCQSQVGGTNESVAFKGCMNYVGYYIIEEEHLACCPSSVCDEWLDEMLESLNIEDLEGYEDDPEILEDEF